MLIEFDDGWELHVRIQIHSNGTKKQASFSIRHTHANTDMVITGIGAGGWDWLVKDITGPLGSSAYCRACHISIPDALRGSMDLISWSTKDAD